MYPGVVGNRDVSDMSDKTDPISELDDLEFPEAAPRDSCIDAILAAQDYIHDHDGATRDEIVTDLVPEENYPLGHNGVAASAKGFTSFFREQWWDDVVESGLRALSNVDKPDIEGRLWLPTQDVG